jgi:hypothetical protein
MLVSEFNKAGDHEKAFQTATDWTHVFTRDRLFGNLGDTDKYPNFGSPYLVL